MEVLPLFRHTFKDFFEDQCANLAASLSYFTLFAIGPFLVLMIAALSFFFGRERASEEIFRQLHTLIGADGANMIEEIVRHTYFSGASFWAASIGAAILFWGATSIFLQIQAALDQIWSVKPKPRRNTVLKMLRDRFLSFGLILALGFLMIVSLAMNTLLALLSARLQERFSGASVALMEILNVSASILVYTVLFTLIFKILPDVKLRWGHAARGAMLTACLFIIGQTVIGLVLASSRTVSIYGAAASLILFILWVNYSSLILFFGAEFTKNYSRARTGRIDPADYAVLVEKRERPVRHML